MPIRESAEAVNATVDALKSTPLALALLVVNVCFLVAAVYVLHEISTSSTARSRMQMELISALALKCAPIEKGRS